MEVCCPHCRRSFGLSDESSLADIACPVCGNSLNLLSEDGAITFPSEFGAGQAEELRPRATQGADLDLDLAAGDDDPQDPEQIGRFQIRRRLGKGGFGVVYLAHDPGLDRLVAIKVPCPELLKSGQQRENFLQEARTAAKLKHPALVTVHEVQQEGDLIYIVLEYIEGQNLAEWAKTQPRSWQEITSQMLEVATAIGYVHQQGFYHRDLKPGNILLDNDGHAYVADFGLAVHEDALRMLKGKAPGTPPYMSPEQVRGETHWIDGRTDIWALGVILYELLTGRRPFTSPDMLELFAEILERDPKSPRMKNPSLPKELERICFKCLAKRRTQRYATASDLLEDLQAVLTSGSVSQPAAGTDSTPVATGSSLTARGGAAVQAHADSATLSATPTPDSGSQPPLRIVPKGLRSFDEADKDFFLELLPGPRDREGLPDTLRFWKTRIEQTDAGATFPVGVMYGPSGCGKSSLVKAGLLPQLASHVLPVFIEATPGDTELRLLKRLHQKMPALASDVSLAETLAELREGRGADGQKVLLVLDQFEQWLHATASLDSSQLVRALRQCDGANVQCLILVRDDFWMSTTRFMQALEIPQVEGMNSASVDLFDPSHARKVLRAFGLAYGRLPQHDLSADEQRFLDRAVQDLAHDGKVICVQLSLFADMMKGRSWTPASLQEVGGTSGVGVAFLDETFTAKTAAPTHRRHAKAASAVLKALLPQASDDIKGQMQPVELLLECSGYAHRPEDFRDVLQILNGELRLITPTEPEEAEAGATETTSSTGKQQYYQLTHDYLVPSLRDWLTRKQKETRRGRAELRLAERSASWNARPVNRQLPKAWEHLNIRWLTRKKYWTESQRRMMRRSGRFHLLRAAALGIMIGLLGWSAYEINGRFQADKMLTALDDAKEDAVLGILDELSPYRRWARRGLRDRVAISAKTPAVQRRQLHARIALASEDDTQVPELLKVLLTTELSYVGVLRDVLLDQQDKLSEELWKTLHDPAAPNEQRFRAALALTSFATTSKNWSDSDLQFVAQQLVSANPVEQPRLWDYLAPLSERLVLPLEQIFRNQELPESQLTSAANAIKLFARGDAVRVMRLLTVANAAQFKILCPLVSRSPDDSVKAVLADMVSGTPGEDLSEEERVALGRQRAGAAINLLRMGEVETSFGAFQIDDDPESLTQFVHRCRDRDVTAMELVESFHKATTVHSRFALLLALGDYSPIQIDKTQYDRLVKELTEAYRTDPSSAIHGAAGWLLRQWGFEQEVATVDHTPLPYDKTGKREWYVQEFSSQSAGATNSQTNLESSRQQPPQKVYFTFVVFRPDEYWMGSPEGEQAHQVSEYLHRVTLTGFFAVSMYETMWSQYDPLLGGQRHASWEKQFGRKLTPEEPVFGVNWYEAVDFCRLLTQQAGWPDPESQQCYEASNELPQDVRGNPQHSTLHLDRQGFRLLNAEEWEYVCRAGMHSTFSFGSDKELLTNYAWYQDNSPKWSHATGLLRPNLRGLFDVHGNLLEWCNDWWIFGDKTGSFRASKSGSWTLSATGCRSASNYSALANYNNCDLGFRVAVTVPAPSPAGGDR